MKQKHPLRFVFQRHEDCIYRIMGRHLPPLDLNKIMQQLTQLQSALSLPPIKT